MDGIYKHCFSFQVTVPSVPYKSINIFVSCFFFLNNLLILITVRIHGEKNIKKYGDQEIIINPVDFPDPLMVEQ